MIGVALLLANIPAIICLVIAAYLAVNSIYGWGWFLFMALLISKSATMNENNSDEDGKTKQ